MTILVLKSLNGREVSLVFDAGGGSVLSTGKQGLRILGG